MRQTIWHDGDKPYRLINKAKARRLFAQGVTVTFCPCKLRPFGPWGPQVAIVPKDYEISGRPFDTVVQDFEWYNCNLNETGYYTAFYIPC